MIPCRKLVAGLFTVLVVMTAGPVDVRAEQAGIGLQVVPVEGGGLTVLQVVADSPAARAGLQPGDLIVRVNGQSLKGMDFREVSRKVLWGGPGSPVALIFLRPGEAGMQKVTLIRAELGETPAPPPGVKLLRPAEDGDKGDGKP